ncbi:hypothetical protein K1719_020837 [Acacia pycnantha]|nr:hypothetical protein K1719_020837 [Acacia pycnantha]
MSASSKARERLQGVNLNSHCVRLRGGAWVPPSPGWVKLNVDGACAGNQIASCGGILRDDSGTLKQGFMFRAEEPEIAFELSYGLFSSALRCVGMPGNAERAWNPTPKRNWEVLVSWIPREANMAADYVAKQALDTWPGLHQFHAAFGGLDTVLDKDKESVMYSSGFG